MIKKSDVAYTTNECKLNYTQPQCLCHGTTQYIDTGVNAADIKKISTEKRFGGAFDIVRHFYNGAIAGYTTVKITKVIYNDPATIVFWNDGTKTVSKVHDGDTYNCEMGLVLCVLKKTAKPESVIKLFKDWLPEEGNIVTMKDVRRRHKNDE